ncbi:MAG: response regulator [Clostridium sp.]|nr:response regulator [Clostridium sp.]
MKKILIVDDESNIRLGLNKCLAKEGYYIEEASNGEEALQLIYNKKYDLILMDVQMPELNGFDVLKRIRKFGNSTRVIMMTAFGTVEMAVDSMKIGAVDFLSKPFTISKVRDVVKEVLDKDMNILRVDKDISRYIEEARDAIFNKDYDKAKFCLKEALVNDSSSAEIQNLLGVIEEKTGDRQLAQKYYRAALSLDPTYELY